MKHIVKKPGLEAEVFDTALDLDKMQEYVGGLIELVYIPELAYHGIDVYANEEGLLLGLELNLARPPIVGPIIMVSSNNLGETVGLEAYQISLGLTYIDLAVLS